MPSIIVFRRKRKRKDGTEYPDKIWSVRIKFGRQAEFLRSTKKTSEREALREAKRIAKQIEEKELPEINHVYMTISEMFGQWWIKCASQTQTADTMMMRAEKFLKFRGENLLIKDLTNSHINQYVQARKDAGKAGATINRETDILKKALGMARRRWGEKVQDILWEDFRQSEAKEREILVTPEEVQEIFAHLPEHIKLAAAWSIYTGCRLNETATLEKNAVLFE